MNKKILKLLAILDEEVACCKDMKTILADEEESISLSGKERFHQVQLEKEALVAKIKQSEKKRQHLVNQLAEIYQVVEPIVTVSKLSQYLPAPYNEKLLLRAEQLRSHLGEVQLKNKHNQQLLRHYLDLIQGSLKLLTHMIDNNSIYRKPGSDHPSTGYRSTGGRIFCGNV